MSKLLTLFGLVFIVSSFNSARASHLNSGEIYYEYLGSDQYRITLVVYRDCLSTGAQLDNPLALGVFDAQTNTLFQSVMVPSLNPVDTVPFSILCDTILGVNGCWQRQTYQTVLTLPANPEGYIVTYQRCCVIPAVMNIQNSSDFGFTLSTTINGTNSFAPINSSPYFKEEPPMVICLNDVVTFDQGAIDLDGDSLVYALDSCWKGGSWLNNVAPNPPNAPPYGHFNWENGFSALSPLGASSMVSLDLLGNLTFVPSMIGDFMVVVRADEYRDGALIGHTKRPFVVRVVSTLPSTASIADNIYGNRVELFPNPVEGLCTIKNAKNGHLTITDSSGKRLFKGEVKSDEEMIQMEEYDAGLYYFILDFDGNQVIRKMSKL